MLSLYYQPNLSEETNLMADALWFDVLGDIPQAAIDQSCREWERENENRPTPAGIRKMALTRIHKPVRAVDLAPPPIVVSEKELAARQKQQAELRREFPMLRKMPKGWD